MAEGLTLWGYGPSVYTRIVRIALIEMGLEAAYVEMDPFVRPRDARLTGINPLHRVPVLQHAGLALTETAAILQYLDTLSRNGSFIPDTARDAARMRQIICIIDSHGYWPLVRQVFVKGYLRVRDGQPSDGAEMRNGLAAAVPVLAMLDRILAGADAENPTLADFHLVPMLASFRMAPEGAALLKEHRHLAHRWQMLAARESVIATDPLRS